MREIKDIKATGEFVVLKMVVKKQNDDFKQKKSGLYVPNQPSEQTSTGGGKIELDYAVVHEVGPNVEDDSFKVGDRVIFNDYDIKYVGSEKNMYGITKAGSIMATYEPGEEIED